jgi:hypothetical protein
MDRIHRRAQVGGYGAWYQGSRLTEEVIDRRPAASP